ncbi:hypothetical protein SteCoe_37326 [Stentor coeruleus]|uniref:Uncharacterized protein n=1 Tax=Stentor coeruleus TaxID=5963 RepID=A0A1R2AN95_9CILI|nr:hypothetical protein SteCoe_37326 [Stentor coeruleus]
MIKTTPINISRKLDLVKVPKVTISVKKKPKNVFSNMPLQDNCMIKFDDPLTINSRPHFPPPRKIRSKFVIEDFAAEKIFMNKIDSGGGLSIVAEEPSFYTRRPSNSISPKILMTPRKKNFSLEIGISDGDYSKGYLQGKKIPKKYSAYPFSAYDKFFIQSAKIAAKQQREYAKVANTPSPGKGIPKYIDQEKNKAGHFLSKISKALSRIRVYRSKSSLYGYSIYKSPGGLL